MYVELLVDTVKLLVILTCLCLGVVTYVRTRRPQWSVPLAKRRRAILWALGLAVLAVKISEDVVFAESGPIDKAVLRHIHASVPAAFIPVFEFITVFGAFRFLLPLTLIAALWLLYEQRRAEAFLLAASVITSAVFVYVVKAIVQRDRPTLWQTEWYWGSSFPSGHALVFSAFAISAALCVARIWPMQRTLALSVAILCLVMVAFSRLVLGVHWPTDVLAAVCIGVFIPLAMDITLHLYFYLRRS